MASPLVSEFEYYLANRDELLKKYEGQVIVIKNQKVIGVYDSELEAVRETSKTEEMGTFLVQRCVRDESSFTQTFHSRVAFA